MDLSQRPSLPGRALWPKVLGLVGVHLVVWCGALANAVPIAELALSWGFSPERLLAPGGEALVDTYVHAAKWRPNADTYGRALTWLLTALVARTALMELTRSTLTTPSLRRTLAYVLAWLSGRATLGLLLGLGWFVMRALDSAMWLEANPRGAALVLISGLALLALGRALDAWLSISWTEETDASDQLFGALRRVPGWLGGFLRRAVRLWISSLGVVVGRALLLALCAKWSLEYVRAGQLHELVVLSHLTLLLNLGLELVWYEVVMRVQGRS
jgi:hypothetical protein